MIVRKLLVNDGRGERELLLVGTIVVGRDPSCHLNDLDPLLSRRHAEFVSTGKGVTIRDLHSRNGILVNGDKVPEHALQPGDVIQLGHLHLRYIEELVVKSSEDHTRAHATTATGMELPTMAPPARPAAAAPAPPAAIAPTESAPSPAAAVPPASMLPDELDMDATGVLPPRHPAPAPQPVPRGAVRIEDDEDATRAPDRKAPVAVGDPDATRVPLSGAPSALSVDETRAPTGKSPDSELAATRAVRPTEARLVANASLIVTEASPSCHVVIGARPETLIGGQLADAVSRSLTFVATGDGPSSLSLSISRASSGKTITVTFKAGQATENLS